MLKKKIKKSTLSVAKKTRQSGKESNICTVKFQLKVDAVLEIMQKAVVPWSNVVETLVQQYLEMDGPKYDHTPHLEITAKNRSLILFLFLDKSF